MKNLRWTPLLILLFGLQMACAQTTPELRQVSLNGFGEVTTTPDMAEISMSVTSIKRVSADAKSDVDERVNNYLAALEELGIAEEDIVAATLRTSPQYEYKTSLRIFSGYRADRSLQITVQDLDQLDAVMQTALDQKIDNIGNINYKSSEEDQLRLDARAAAIADSKAKAQALAEAYDAELGPIHSISYYSSQPTPMPQMERMQMSSMSDASGGGQYLPDQLVFNDSIQVVFELLVSP